MRSQKQVWTSCDSMVDRNQNRTAFTVIALFMVLDIIFFRLFDFALLALGTFEREHFLPPSRFSKATNHRSVLIILRQTAVRVDHAMGNAMAKLSGGEKSRPRTDCPIRGRYVPVWAMAGTGTPANLNTVP